GGSMDNPFNPFNSFDHLVGTHGGRGDVCTTAALDKVYQLPQSLENDTLPRQRKICASQQWTARLPVNGSWSFQNVSPEEVRSGSTSGPNALQTGAEFGVNFTVVEARL